MKTDATTHLENQNSPDNARPAQEAGQESLTPEEIRKIKVKEAIERRWGKLPKAVEPSIDTPVALPKGF